MNRTPTQQPLWDEGPSPTSYELRQLAFAVLLFELVIAALTIATRAFFGVQTAVWVGLGIGLLVLAAFALVLLFGGFAHIVAAFLARRETRARGDR